MQDFKQNQLPGIGMQDEADDKDMVTKKHKGVLEVVRYKNELRGGIELGDAVSCLQKAIRRADEEVAMTVAFLILEKYPFYLFRRLSIISAEDLASPLACVVANSIYNAWILNRQRQSAFRGRVMVAKLILYLCRAKKSREADHITILTGAKLDNQEPFELPKYTYDFHTKKGRSLGLGVKDFHENAAKLVNATKTDKYRNKMVCYLKKLGKYI